MAQDGHAAEWAGAAAMSQDSDIDGRRAWMRLLVGLVLGTIGTTGMWSHMVTLPLVQAEFAVSRSDAAVPYLLSMVGFGVGGVLMGRITDRLGVMVAILAGTGLLGVGYVAAGLAQSLWQYALAYSVIGIGCSAMFVPLMADISHWFLRRRGIAVAICSCGNALSGTLWPPILQHVNAADGWRTTHIGYGIGAVLLLFPLALAFRQRAPRRAAGLQTAGVWQSRPIALSPRLLQGLLMLAGVGCCIAMATPQVHIVAYCGDLGYGPARGAEMLALMLCMSIVSRLIAGVIADRIGAMATLLLGSTLQALTLLLYLPYDGLVSLYVISAMFGLFMGGIIPMYTLIVREFFAPQEAGQRVGTVIMATLVGMALGGWVTGAIFDATGSYRTAFSHSFLWNVLNIAIVSFLIWRVRSAKRHALELASSPAQAALADLSPRRLLMAAARQAGAGSRGQAPAAVPRAREGSGSVDGRPRLDDDIDGRRAWWRLAAGLALGTVGSTGMWSAVVALPAIQAEFGAARSDVSLPYTLGMLTLGFGGIFMGRLTDRFGVLIPFLLSTALLTAGYVLAGLAQSLWQYTLAFGLLIGLGSSAMFAPLMADISHWFSRRRGIAVAIAASGTYLAGTVWPPILQWLIDTQGWRDMHIIYGILCAVIMLPLSLAFQRRAPIGSFSASHAATWTPKPIRVPSVALQPLLVIAGVACCVAMSMPQVHIVAYCGDLGYGPARGAEMLSLMLGLGVVSRLISGAVADRIGALATLLLGSALQGVALLLFLPFDGLVSLYVISGLFGLFQGGIVPMYALIVRDYFSPAEAGARVGVVIMATLIGMAFGGWISGAIFDWTGSYKMAFLNGTIWNLLNVAIVGWLLLRTRRVVAAA